MALLDRTQAELEASTDPWVRLAVSLERELLAPERAAQMAWDGAVLRHEPAYVAAVRAVLGLADPDANNTLRVTYGRVVGYAPGDGLVATPRTRLAGLVAKHHTPVYEGPDWLIAQAGQVGSAGRWRDEALADVPVNFLSDVDTTGGNSGSPTLDADGDLVGIVFDGNYESMAADWQFDPATTRTIHVDVRYLAGSSASIPPPPGSRPSSGSARDRPHIASTG